MSGGSIDLTLHAEVETDAERYSLAVADLLEQHVAWLRSEPPPDVPAQGQKVHQAGTVEWDADIIHDQDLSKP